MDENNYGCQKMWRKKYWCENIGAKYWWCEKIMCENNFGGAKK